MNSLRARLLFAVCLVLCCTACVVAVHSPPTRVRHTPAPPPHSVVHVDVSLFYDDLAPYGVWREVDPYGWTWSPYGVRAAWRPYSEGSWVYTDYGWTWVSDWDWGWAPFHYGRWTLDARYGWIWIPGTQWAPAWVAWRHGGGWVGWAPLPPQARWRAGIGLDWRGVDIDVVIRPASWCFVEDRRLVGAGLASRIAFASRNGMLARRTRHVTGYAMVDNRVINRGVDVERIQGISQRPIPRYRLVDHESRGNGARNRVEGRSLRVFRPQIEDAPPRRTPATGTVRRRTAPRDPTRTTDEPSHSYPHHRRPTVERPERFEHGETPGREDASKPGPERRTGKPPAAGSRPPFRPAPGAAANPRPRGDNETPASEPRARSEAKGEARAEGETGKPSEEPKQSAHKSRARGKRGTKKEKKKSKEEDD